MKTLTILFTICSLGFGTICQAQSDQENSKTVPLKQMNLLDEQTKMFGQIFDLAGTGEENPLGGATSYSEVIEKMDAPEEQKEILRKQYKSYELSLISTKKDSLKTMDGNMLNDAIEKSQTEIE